MEYGELAVLPEVLVTAVEFGYLVKGCVVTDSTTLEQLGIVTHAVTVVAVEEFVEQAAIEVEIVERTVKNDLGNGEKEVELVIDQAS